MFFPVIAANSMMKIIMFAVVQEFSRHRIDNNNFSRARSLHHTLLYIIFKHNRPTAAVENSYFHARGSLRREISSGRHPSFASRGCHWNVIFHPRTLFATDRFFSKQTTAAAYSNRTRKLSFPHHRSYYYNIIFPYIYIYIYRRQ